MRLTLACDAMATRFEIVLHGHNPVMLRAAGEEALREIQRVEALLSLYRPSSEVAHLNARAGRQPIRVGAELFHLLARARDLSRLTSGTFDLTVAPLLRCWGFLGGTGREPDPAALLEARQSVGIDLLQLNPDERTVQFSRPGVTLDFGAIGKGYALDCAAELLREAGITSALLHGGTSSVYAIGTPPDGDGWPVAIENPARHLGPAAVDKAGTDHPAPLAVVMLIDESLSISAVWGKSFSSGGRTFGHVIDPRSGIPVQRAVAAGLVLSSATEADALSTALLTLGEEGCECITRVRPGNRHLLILPSPLPPGFTVRTRGIDMAG